jgi:hypothetical protein
MMKKVCLKKIACGAYIRVAEHCKARNNIGLIQLRQDGVWLWVKKQPSGSGATLYSAKDRSSFKPHKGNLDSTPCGGTGYLGGRKFSDLPGVKNYLRKIATVVSC